MTVLCIIMIMSTLLEKKLQQTTYPIITDAQLAYLLGNTKASTQARLKRAVKNGDLTRVKRGLYYINKPYHAPPHPFDLAQKIYGPSYISLESALSYHGLIPEAVNAITSVTTQRNKNFNTPAGQFIFQKLPNKYFYTGTLHITENQTSFIMANQWKALLDYVYCHKKQYKNFHQLIDDLRLDTDELPNISKLELDQLDRFYCCNRLNQLIKLIKKEEYVS